MLSSIHPFGERSRHSRWGITVTAYLLGSIAGGATTGAVAGMLGSFAGSIVDGRTAAILAIAGAVGVAVDLGLWGLRIPSIHRQVDERWLMRYRGWVYGLGFGYQLGLGLVTIIPTSAVWLTWLAAAGTASVGAGAFIGVVFGAVRGSFILLTARVQAPSELRQLHRGLAATAPRVARLTTTGVALAGVIAAIGAMQ